jgi:hypothetical protein
MPQSVLKQITTAGHALVATTPTLIPGLTATLLTGSGWIKVHAWANIINYQATGYTHTFLLKVDGVIATYYTPGWTAISAGQNCWARADIDYLARLGAGTHTFELFAFSDVANALIAGLNAFMEVTELGF